MFNTFQQHIYNKELVLLRQLNVLASVVITILGFVFEFSYHDGYILVSGLFISMLFTSNYFLSFYITIYRRHFSNITYVSVFMMHLWGVYVAYLRNFDASFLLPITLSIFVFSLIFDKIYKSLLFIFIITSVLLVLMLQSGNWQSRYTIACVALYSSAIIADLILKRKNDYQLEIESNENRYIALVENMNDGLIYTDLNWNVIFVNDRFCNITNYDRNEVLHKSIFIFFKQIAEQPTAGKFFKNLEQGLALGSEARMVTKNGSTIWVQMNGASLKSEESNKQGYNIVLTDITAIKKIEEELKQKEEGYRTFIEQSSVGIWRAEYFSPLPIHLPIESQIDHLLEQGYIAECNEFMANMYGYSTIAALVGKKIKDFYYIENNFDSNKTNEILTEFILSNYRISNAETKEIDRHGNVRYMLNNNIGIIENNHLIRTWGVQTDITERKKTERELIETNKELDTFFYKASHDLKGPLASIMGIVNLARLEQDTNATQNFFDMIESSTIRLDNTLVDLIELARSRKGVSKLSEVNVSQLVNNILSSLSHIKGYEQSEIKVNIDPQLNLITDKVLLTSILQNLIHNAINYCKRIDPVIKVQAKQENKNVIFEVIDNGPGIALHIRDKVFEMFYRGNPDSPGSGLGLFIVKNAVEKLQGKISYDTQEGKGTNFIVSLPLQLNLD